MLSPFRIAILTVGVSSFLSNGALAYHKEPNPQHAQTMNRMPPQGAPMQVAMLRAGHKKDAMRIQVANLEDMPRAGGQEPRFNQSTKDPIIKNGSLKFRVNLLS